MFTVAGTATENAAQRILHLALARTRRALDQRRSGEQHAGRADTALSSAMMMEGLLQPRQSAIGKAFDGLNRAALDLPHGRKAGAHGLASSTVQAPQSPASQPTLVPVSRRSSRSIRQAPHRRRLDRHLATVQRKRERWRLLQPTLHLVERASNERTGGVQAIGGRTANVAHRPKRRKMLVSDNLGKAPVGNRRARPRLWAETAARLEHAADRVTAAAWTRP